MTRFTRVWVTFIKFIYITLSRSCGDYSVANSPIYDIIVKTAVMHAGRSFPQNITL